MKRKLIIVLGVVMTASTYGMNQLPPKYITMNQLKCPVIAVADGVPKEEYQLTVGGVVTFKRAWGLSSDVGRILEVDRTHKQLLVKTKRQTLQVKFKDITAVPYTMRNRTHQKTLAEFAKYYVDLYRMYDHDYDENSSTLVSHTKSMVPTFLDFEYVTRNQQMTFEQIRPHDVVFYINPRGDLAMHAVHKLDRKTGVWSVYGHKDYLADSGEFDEIPEFQHDVVTPKNFRGVLSLNLKEIDQISLHYERAIKYGEMTRSKAVFLINNFRMRDQLYPRSRVTVGKTNDFRAS